MKGSDKILARGHVDRGLAADAAVDLREQGRRDLDEVAAALDDAAREPDEVTDHTAAKGYDMVAALDTFGDQPFGEPREARPAFRAFAGRSEEHTSELQSLMRISYAVFCLKKKKNTKA